MSEEIGAKLVAVLGRALTLVNRDTELRGHLRALAQAVLNATADLAAPPAAPDAQAKLSPAPAESNGSAAAHAPAAPPRETIAPSKPARAEPASREPLPELTLGRASPRPLEPARPSYPASAANHYGEDHLALIEDRCRLKAEGSRWAATRRRVLAEGGNFFTDVDPTDRDIIARAKSLPNCYLWMNNPNGPATLELPHYEELANCYETLGDALALMRQIMDEPAEAQVEFDPALDLVAEAQSAVRVAVERFDGNKDTDQSEVYHWLRAIGQERQILIRRFMRLDDPADPSHWSDLAARIQAVDARLQEVRGRSKERKKLLGKVRHKSSLIADKPDNAEEQWKILADTIEQLVSAGMPPSNRELREAVMPIVESLPDALDALPGFAAVLREIDRFVANYPPPESPHVVQPSPQVQEAAKLLRGKAMVLIGGSRRPGAAQALKEAFELSELYWLESQEHQSIDRFHPYVARPDVALVLLAIRWSSHSFGEVTAFCSEYDKPLVRLPGGYNPNQVAAQIMSQCSARLG